MKNISLVACWEYATRIRSKGFIITTLLIPLIFVGFMVIPTLLLTGADTEEKLIAIVDGTNIIGEKVDAALTERYRLKSGRPKYQTVMFKDGAFERLKTQAAELLDSAVVQAYLTIPASVLDSNTVNYYAKNIGNVKDQNEIQRVVNSIVSRERMLAANLSPEQISRLTRDVNFHTIEVSQIGQEREGNELMAYMTPIVFVMMLFFAIFSSSQILMRSVLTERNNRLVEILLSSVSSRELMSGKILGLGLLGLTQMIIYISVAIGISYVRGIELLNSTDVFLFLMYFALGYMLYAAIFAAFGSIFQSEQDAQYTVSIFSIITVIPIVLASYVITNPNASLTVILSFIPLMTPFFMILRIGIEIPPVWEIIATTGLLFLCVVLVMMAAGKIFRVAILIYGKRPTLPEIWQWVKA